MGFLVVPVAVFLFIVAVLVLKDFHPANTGKKTLKVLIFIGFVALFAISSYFLTR